MQPLAPLRQPQLIELANPESLGRRFVYSLLAGATALAFLAMFLTYWAPAYPGADQNAYLVGGKMLATQQWTGLHPSDPYSFIGSMWIGKGLSAPTPSYFPKYPLGAPALYALCLKAGPLWAMARPHLIDQPFLRNTALWLSPADGRTLAYLLSPVLMSASLCAMFLLGRNVGGSFGGIMAMLLLGTSQILLGEANIPGSHAASLCFVTFGMHLLIRWWQTDRLWRGVLGGLFLGFATTIRYTDGLLLLPLLLAAAAMPWRRSWVVVFAWAIPVAAMLWFNLHFIGRVTGYDTTGESIGFTWAKFHDKWESVLQQLYDHSVFFAPSIAIVGMIALFSESRRWSLLLASWLVPGILVYTAYYWGGGETNVGIGFLRFFLTLLPPLILAAIWLMTTKLRSSLAAGVVVAFAGSIGFRIALPQMERAQATNLNLAFTVHQITARVPSANAMVMADNRRHFGFLNNALQFAGDFDLYTVDAFSQPGTNDLRIQTPSPNQPERTAALAHLFPDGSDVDDVKDAHRAMQTAMNAGKQVLVILQPASLDWFRQTFVSDGFTADVIDRWTEPAVVPPEPDFDPLAPAAHGYAFSWIRPPLSFECLRISKAQ